MMPGMSGPDVCRQVRQQSKEQYTYLILLTSRHEKEDLIAGMESGADEYLVKPFDNNELKARLGPGRRIVELQAELLKAKESLREQATRDSLTLLWNRYAIYEMLNRELARSYRESTGFGVVMADLDRFKLINDTFGHIAGDAVLREVGVRLRSVVRAYDAVGRYGGEEFLIILPGCDINDALHTAERVRERIQSEPVTLSPELCPNGTGYIPITASFGVTAMVRGRHATPEQVIRCADEALYAAKQQGRNRSVSVVFP
jgi:diguanylate cyclase (GGDEF)-like protein